MLMLPFVKLSGSAENFRDGQFILWLAGLAPALPLPGAREAPPHRALAAHASGENLVLALLFAFGTVYFFTAVEGTVWFAAMVVATAASALYVLFALDAERPVLAGAMIGCALPQPPAGGLDGAALRARGGPRVDAEASRRARGSACARLGARRGGLRGATLVFALPILAALAFVAWMNWTAVPPADAHSTSTTSS